MIERRVRAIVGADGEVDVGVSGHVEVAPRSEEECALLLAAAYKEGWGVRFSGSGGWMPLDAPADFTISTRCLNGIADISPADLVLTALAGTPLADLQSAAAQQGTWIALDPPGAARSLGSTLATATSGPLRTGFGAVRSRVLGLTFITADGRIVRVGGRVVKNVAGFDLTSLLVGSFGAFGMITSAHIRLNAIPARDVTLVAFGTRNSLLRDAGAILASGTTPAGMELIAADPRDGSTWSLCVRLIGSKTAVAADHRNVVTASSDLTFDTLEGDSAARFWESASAATIEAPTTIRIGCLQSELGPALALLNAMLSEHTGVAASVSILSGVVRWSCETSERKIRDLREAAAQHSWPVTLERAPWSVLSGAGHYGAFRSGVGRLVESLRGVFDDRGLIVAPLGQTA